MSGGPGAPEIVDLHAHLLPEEWLTTVARDPDAYGLAAVGGDDGAWTLVRPDTGEEFALPRPFWSVPDRLAWMRERGIARQLAAPPTFALFYDLPRPQACAVARLFNETVAAVAKAAGDAFIPAATVPLGWPDAAVAELEHAVEVLGLPIVYVGSKVRDADLDDPELRPFLRRAAELGVAVQIHPAQHLADPRLRRYFFENLIGNPMETAVAAGKLIAAGVLDELPDLRIALVHGGGVLPYLAGRLDHGYRHVPPARNSRDRPSSYLGRFHYDTITHDPRALEYLVRTVGPERLVAGTDAPYAMGDDDPLGTLAAAGLDPRRLAATADRFVTAPA